MMKKFGFAIVGVAATAAALFAINQQPSGMVLHSTDHAFNKYMAKFGKSYVSKEEYEYRKSLFEARVADIMTHNSQNNAGWTMGMNRFVDMTPQEIRSTLGGGVAGEHRPTLPPMEEKLHHHHVEQANGPVDWRGQMNAPKDQGGCGSCWSFGAVASIEGRVAIKTGGAPPVLSEQHLVDCVKGCYGCGGGWIAPALQYVMTAPGIQAASTYPYTGVDGTCKFDPSKAAVGLTAVYGVADAKAEVGRGPVAVYIQAQSGFMYYSTGIFDGICGQYDHVVAVVGWGTDGTTEYWIIRNSWGSGWGEQGHIRVKINGNCRVTFDTYPVIA